MDIGMLAIPGMFFAAVGVSHFLGMLSNIPLWLIGMLTSTFPMLLFCLSVPRAEWAEAMMIIGGYALGFGPFLGLFCYKVAKLPRESVQLAKGQAAIRATYERRS